MGARRDHWSLYLMITVFVLFTYVYTETYNPSTQASPAYSCKRPCINGICSYYETCSCKYGYLKNQTDKYKCFALCKGGCPKNAQCAAPRTCECREGYSLETRACGKENGPCVCEPGWKLYHSSGLCKRCVPQCDPACGDGVCTSPNVCQCLAGYDNQRNSNMTVNSPQCEPQCNNCDGTCVAPNKCICNPPYETRNVSATGDDCECFGNCSKLERQCVRIICEMAKSSVWPGYWIYILVVIVIMALASIAALYIRVSIRKRKVCNYDVTYYDTKAAPTQEDDSPNTLTISNL